MGVLKDYIQLLSNYNDYYKAQLDGFKGVNVVPCSEVLTKDQIDVIKREIRPKIKQCYKNALLMSARFGFDYCEGYVYRNIPLEHAINKVGDKYIDVTFEFALKEDVREIEYATIGEYSAKDAMRVALKTEVTGGVFRHYYMKSH